MEREAVRKQKIQKDIIAKQIAERHNRGTHKKKYARILDKSTL